MRIGEKEYRIRTGLIIFLALSIIGAMAVFYLNPDTDTAGTVASLKDIKPGYGLLAGIAIIVYWCLNGLKFQILIKGLGADVSFWNSFRAFVANLFLGAVTPFQTGGGPLQIYILNRAGVPLAIAFSGCLVGAMLTILSLVSSTIVIILLKRDLISEFGQVMGAIFSTVSLIFLIAMALFILSIFKMGMLKWIIGRSLNFLTRGKTSLTERAMGGLDQYSEYMSIYAKAQKRTLVAAGILTLISMAVFSSVACLILAGMNCPQDVPRVFLKQFVLNFIVYFSPTPGGSGIAELCTSVIMKPITNDPTMTKIYVLVWRFFTNFMGVGLGGLIVLTLFRKERRRAAKREI